jgi:hypothetical protein
LIAPGAPRASCTLVVPRVCPVCQEPVDTAMSEMVIPSHPTPQEPVDKAMKEINTDDGSSDKSMSFSTYVQIQAEAQKALNTKSLSATNATMVPQVKAVTLTDPSLQHLL